MFISSVTRRLALILIKAYQLLISPFLGNNCKFYPSCSSYALEAFKKYSPFKAMKMTGIRLLKCSSLSDGGIDEVK